MNLETNNINKKFEQGYSLISCSMNREENLLKSIKTWNNVSNLNEIIIVDYSSDVNIDYAKLVNKKHNKKIKLIRVEGESKWILSHAFNLASYFVNYDKLLKIDADIKLHKDFLINHPLNNNSFYRGNYKNARNQNEIYLNGQFLCKTKKFVKIGGYNENIVTYGWDDSDLYQRLENDLGLNPLDFSYDDMKHILTKDEKRSQSQNIDVNDKFALIELFENKKIDIDILKELAWIPFPTSGESVRLFFETQMNRIKSRETNWTNASKKVEWEFQKTDENKWLCKRAV